MQFSKYTHHTHLLFRTRQHLCRQGLALAGTRQLRSRGLVSVHAHRNEEVTRSQRREGANGVGGGNGDGNGVGGRNGDVDVDGDGDGAGTGTRVEASERMQNKNGDGSGDGDGEEAGTGTGVETRRRTRDVNGDSSGDANESSSGDGNGDEDGNGHGKEDGIGEGGGKVKKRKRSHKGCRRDVGNGGDSGGKGKIRRQKRVGSVAADPANIEIIKEAKGEALGTQDLSKDRTIRESVSPLSRLIRGFCISIIDPPLGGSMHYTSKESVSPLSRLIRVFRNKYH